MPDEYISRKAAAKLLGYTFGVDVVRKLHEVPAADVAPVVRCKDCIYRIEGRCFSRTSFINAPAVEPDNFCSWGATE